MLNPASPSKNWLSSSVISDIESNLKVTMASKYLSRLLRNHLFCSQCNASLSEDKVLNEYNSHQIEELTCDLTAVISIFDRRFSLKFSDIAEKVMLGDHSFELFIITKPRSNFFCIMFADSNLLLS